MINYQTSSGLQDFWTINSMNQLDQRVSSLEALPLSAQIRDLSERIAACAAWYVHQRRVGFWYYGLDRQMQFPKK